MGGLTGALGAAAVVLGLGAAQAAGQASPAACGQAQGAQCVSISVPLDRSGSVPGTISLAVTRIPATSGHSSGALVVLAGGPGQAATPLLGHFTQDLAPALAARDLVIFDQRGTGGSGLLSCPGLDQVNSASTLAFQSQACAASLGPRRPFYTTRDSVDDIEAVRQWTGVDRIALFGGSYGTKVALSYATRYPQHVELLILDSVVPLDAGAFNQDTFAAIPRVLRDICAGACAGITTDPVRDLAALAARLRQRPLRGRVALPTGPSVPAVVDGTTLFNLLATTDQDPFLRAEFPGVVRSTLNHDSAPLLRMLRQAGTGAAAASKPGDSAAVNFATLCEEYPLPWSRTAALADRPAQAVGAARALPASTFFPFDPGVAVAIPPGSQCLNWPQAPNPPVISGGPLPAVPALLLEGSDDLRTPIEGAQRVGQQLPGATVVQVPDTGHDTLDNDPHACASGALGRFIAGQPPAPCPSPSKLLAPFPLAPQSLAAVPGAGRARKTVQAARDTAADVERSALYDAVSAGSTSAPVHDVGLRGGSFSGQFTGSVRLHRIVYVPGVVVSGTLDEARGVGHLSISGRAAAHLRLTVTKRSSPRARLTSSSRRWPGYGNLDWFR
jgi:pimeloyl-ACP methyl ester carboxylesterase